ncbi:MAG: ABC transporter permease, partial [Clostridium sp.]|nr:ABC transporter permease [Clostridium sp.]
MENEVRAEKTGWWKSFLSSEFFFHYKHNIPAIIGSILVLIAILTAVVGRFLAPQNPYDLTQINLSDSYLPPFWLDGGKMSFLLGTDEQGRDILSAIIYGSASSIMIGLVGMAASCCIGTTLGLIAGYFGGKVDAVIMR